MRHKVEFKNGAFQIHLQGELNHLVATGEVSIDEPNFKEAFDKKLKELIEIFIHVHEVFFQRQLEEARERIKRQTDECYAMMTLKKKLRAISMDDDWKDYYNNERPDDDLKHLKGLKIVGFEHLHEGYVKFYTETEVLIYTIDADCCSESWIEHVDDLDNLLGQTVLYTAHINLQGVEVEDLRHPNIKNMEDSIQAKDYIIRTIKGDCRLEFRNASNGYYGGSLCFQKRVSL